MILGLLIKAPRRTLMDQGEHGTAKGSQMSADLDGHTERNAVTRRSRLVPVGGDPR